MEGIPMPLLLLNSTHLRTVLIMFGLLVSVVVQAGTFTNTSTALTAPASSSTGNYTVSFKTSAWGTHYLQEKKNSGGWVNIKTYVTNPNGTTSYPSITRNVSVSGRTSAMYSYRVRFVAPSESTLSSGYSNIKVTTVSIVPGIPSSISAPSSDNDGSFSVSWGSSSGTVTSYKLEQQLNSGSWSQIYSGTSLSQSVSGLTDGTYRYRVRACNSSGCSGYRTASNNTVVISPPGTPPSITITEL